MIRTKGFTAVSSAASIATNKPAQIVGDDERKKITPTTADATNEFMNNCNSKGTTNAAELQAPPAVRVSMAKKFLDLLFGGVQEGYSYLWTKQDKRSLPFEIANADERGKMARKAIELADEFDVYVGINVVGEAVDEYKRAKDDIVTFQTATITDIDTEGGEHISKGDKIYPTTFDVAKSFLPFELSLLIHSGYGLQGYCLYQKPITITANNRAACKARNKKFLDVIRNRAGKYKKAVDGVHDLPRILRIPGTFNYKIPDNPQLVRIVETNDVRFSPAEFDEQLSAADKRENSKPARQLKQTTPAADCAILPVDDADFDSFRARRMLDVINPAQLSYDEWLTVISCCKNVGVDYATVDAFSRRDDDRYDAAENLNHWNSITDTNFGLGQLYNIAERFGYDAKDVWREFYKLYPDRRADFNAADNSDVDLLKSALQDAKIALAEFDAEKDAAFELLRNLEEFSCQTIFSDDVLNALGFARAFDYPFFSELKKIIQNYGRQHQNEKVSLIDLGTVTKERAKGIENRYRELITRRNLIQAQINSFNFIAANSNVLGNLQFPKGYEVSLEHGIGRVDKKGSSGSFLVCRRPVIVAEKIFNVEERILNFRLKYQRPDGHWFSLIPVEAAVISNSRKIVDLANSSLPVTTSNGAELVNFLDEFINLNQDAIKTAYTFPRCGWHVVGGTEFFVDGARKTFCADDNKLTVTVDERSEFAKSLRTKGTLDAWKNAYELAKPSTVARMTVAAAVAPPLLKIIGERNFLVYVFAKSRAGKSTALYLAASAIGDEKIIRSFDATKNGLIGVASDVNDFPFIIDEKQVADDRIKEQFTALIYALANGIGRTKLNRDSTLKKLQDWRTIAIMNGETQFLPDNVTEGANTRLLSIKAPNTILSADDCRQIRHIISGNFGHAFPLVVGKILELGADFLKNTYAQILQKIDRVFDDGERDFRYLDEHRRYIAVVSLADALLNCALGVDFDKALAGAESFATYIFKFIPTATELSSVDKFKDFVRSFVAVNLPRFVGGGADGYTQQIFGKIEADFIYIESGTLKKHCADNGIDSRKLVADLVEDGFFVPDNKIKKGHKAALAIVQKKIKGVNAWCYRAPKDKFDAD